MVRIKFRVRDIIGSIDEEDLYKMQADLAKGGLYLKKLVDDRIKEQQNAKRRFCTTCGRALEDNYRTYTLLFGPEDFKKKASFCEVDCLEYFLSGLKAAKTGEVENGVQGHNPRV